MNEFKSSTYVPDRSFRSRLNRRLTQWRIAAPLERSPSRSLITFTFDDFPKSAAETGAKILEAEGARATYYACSGLSGRTLPLGEMFDSDDIVRLQKAGHEIGTHTGTHLDCVRLPLMEVIEDIEQGDREALTLGLNSPARQFAYPFGETSFTLKQHLASRYDCARGILPGINRRGSDRAQLRAVELGDHPARIDRARKAVAEAARTPGWLIFFTHDVRTSPSVYGVSPDVLRELVRAARDSGADLLTMGAAYAALQGVSLAQRCGIPRGIPHPG